ncbi:MAG: efflux transporter outer membrane subunit [Gemmatimonadota bacterium]|nr:efflux transporter outer membrane subunit [Gemmatimonadota bacterium]
MRLRAFTPLVALALGACMMGPNYQRPELPVPEGYRESAPMDSVARDSVLAQDSSFANVRWWEVFQDTVLQRLVRVALEQNLDRRLATERISEASSLLRITKADQYPWISAGAGVSRQQASQEAIRALPDSSRTYTLFEGGVGLSYELDLFGRLRRATERDRAILLATEEAQRTVTMLLVAAVAQSYFDLRAADLQLDVSRRTAESRREYVEIARLRFEGGVTGEIDYRQAQSEYERTRGFVVDFEEQTTLLENALSVLLGHAPAAVPRGDAISGQLLPPAVPEGLPSSLLDRRPDLRSAEQQLAASTADIGVAKALLYPNISLTGFLGLQSRDLSTLANSSAVAWNAAASLVQPIFQGGRNKANVKAAESRMRQQLISYEGTVLNALREVDDALTQYRLAADRRAVTDSQVVYNRIVLGLAEVRYEGGVSQYLEVLDAQRNLLNTELDAVDAVRRQLAALVAVYRSLGGGWEVEEPVEEAPPPSE